MKKGSLKERLEKGNREQKGDKTSDDDGPEIIGISEKGLAKREQKLEEELTASLDNNVRAARNAYFTRKSCTKEERLFLHDQYGGYCQICSKKIKKWDGNSYFEAINIIKPSTMFDSIANSLGLGWNSLSLCPNCAAEYNYCSKKISNIYDQVMNISIEPNSDEPIEIIVEIPEGKQRSIKYSPRHFLALKKAFEVFTKGEE